MENSFTAMIIDFYDPDVKGKDSHGRTLDQILAWPDEAIEIYHNFIQFLFPLPERSRIIGNAPIITREVFDAFRSRPELRDRLRQALGRMVSFYGFKIVEDEEDRNSITIVRGAQWKPAFRNWAHPWNHNHARMSRILRCLRVLGLEIEAQAFFVALQQVDNEIELGRAIEFWTRAAQQPLHVPPSPNDRAISWLKQWENEQKAAKEATEKQATEKQAAEKQAAEEQTTEEQTTEEGAVKEEATKEDASKEDASKKDALKEDASKEQKAGEAQGDANSEDPALNNP